MSDTFDVHAQAQARVGSPNKSRLQHAIASQIDDQKTAWQGLKPAVTESLKG
jgi:hypothetical protein